MKFWILLLTTVAFSQPKFTIKGYFNGTVNKEIILKGFNALDDTVIDKTTTDANGNFTLTYPETYVGAAVLEIVKGKKIVLLLNHEDFTVQWPDLSSSKTLSFTNSVENKTFDSSQTLYQNTQEKKAGINHLLPFYKDEPQKLQFFKTELSQLENIVSEDLKKIDPKIYAGYYLRTKILAANMQLSSKRYPEQLSQYINQFKELDFSDDRLLHSGLYDELLQTFVAVNMNREDKYQRLNEGTDAVLKSLNAKPELKQNCAEYLFNIYEKKSLFEASEHLAMSMLNDKNCNLDSKHQALFEQYRKMATGKTAPDIVFENPQKSHLYDLKNRYKLVVFGASWCQKCTEEIPKLKTFYEDWKNKYNLEIVFISLDTKKAEYDRFVKDFPWISNTDLKGWESKPVTEYCVFATPTMYLLDAQNQIKLKPISAEQIKSWLELHQKDN